jgi:hypothetical protein
MSNSLRSRVTKLEGPAEGPFVCAYVLNLTGRPPEVWRAGNREYRREPGEDDETFKNRALDDSIAIALRPGRMSRLPLLVMLDAA